MLMEKPTSRRPALAIRWVLVCSVLTLIPSVVSRPGIISMTLQPELYAEIVYTLNEEGCDINGTTKIYDGEFSLNITGPCVTYICTNTGVRLKEGSGCMGKGGCVPGLKRHGCQAFVCKEPDHTFNGKKYMWLVNSSAKEQCGILDEQNCFDIHKWYMVLNFQCMCESTTEVVCSWNEQPTAAPANTNDDMVFTSGTNG